LGSENVLNINVPAKGGWGIKAGMVRVWVAGKTVQSHCYIWAISEHFRDAS